MKIQTFERYIRKTAIPYGDLLNRARKGGLKVYEVPDSNGTVEVSNDRGDIMQMFFEDTLVYEENRSNGLIKTVCNYPKS